VVDGEEVEEGGEEGNLGVLGLKKNRFSFSRVIF
jgi:hypothetical protein